MREILFRGKQVDNGEWVYGYYAHFKNMHDVKADIIYTGYADMYMGSILPECYDVNPETVGQYTGLTDKNKTRIFENDILSAHPDELFPNDEIRLMVVWHDYGWFGKDSKGGFISLESKWVNELFEVIGNKFDNPELLKGSAKNE